jgi:TatD DNase family protein
MNLQPLTEDYIDIHTHNTEWEQGVFSVLNVFLTDYPELPFDKTITVGMHPWHLDPDSAKLTANILEKAASRSNVKGIGETGLDKVINTDIEMQKEVFMLHIEVSERLKKPLIIHCVKAFQELIQLKKMTKPSVPWIIHGYHGSEELTAELVTHGFYLSLNEWIIKNPEKGLAMLGKIPLDRLFLETDEFQGNIEGLYKFIGESLNKDIKLSIMDNFKNVFGYTE